MILYVEPCDRVRYARQLEEYFRLRKTVFCHKLGWVEDDGSPIERDEYDDGYCLYVLYQDDNGVIGGGVRLMPTTGPTLLHTVWSDMLPDKDDFRSPNIWEATRFCVDDVKTETRNRSFANRATVTLSYASAEFAHRNGISHIIAVCEQYFFDMTNSYGGKAEILSNKTDENGLKISCGLWSTKEATAAMEWARPFLGSDAPLIAGDVA
ncbi:MAG: GNAT family N-acetyltransferase [Rhizobiaceae bacterium]|nr:GNAT family N-acetyltransferase [Rhizobiaceae bacterium]